MSREGAGCGAGTAAAAGPSPRPAVEFPPVVEAWGRRSGECAEAVALPPGVMERHGVRGASMRIWGRQGGLQEFLEGSGD